MTIKNYHKDDEKVAEIIVLVKENGGVEYAKKIMHDYYKSALNILTTFEENDARKSLILLFEEVLINVDLLKKKPTLDIKEW